MTGVRRRELLRSAATAGLGIAVGAAGGWTAGRGLPTPADAPAPSSAAGRVAPHGAHQAGIARPAKPQPHGVTAVLELPDVPSPGAGTAAFRGMLRDLCARMGETIALLADDDRAGAGEDARLAAGILDGPRDLTVTIGLGPGVVAALDPGLPGAEDLPRFAGDDEIPAERLGGDLLITAHSSSPNDAASAVAMLRDLTGARPRWAQRAFRGPGTGTITRSPLGFHDGIVVPEGDDELDANVWLPGGPLAGGTVCVIRRLRLDAARFRGESTERQEQVVGRRRLDGAPLSGGAQGDDVDLLAKTPEGDLLVPPRAHVRAAHPSFTDSRLMLRRGYAYDDGPGDDTHGGGPDAGLLFTCFQRDLRTFVQTQHRLDEADDLMGYATPTASGTFLVLPGFTPSRPLGASLA